MCFSLSGSTYLCSTNQSSDAKFLCHYDVYDGLGNEIINNDARNNTWHGGVDKQNKPVRFPVPENGKLKMLRSLRE